jgi:hypothetical protein
MDSGTVNGIRVPVVWVGLNTSDSAAMAFVHEFELAGQVYNTPARDDYLRWGVRGTPFIYFLAEGSRLAARGDLFGADTLGVYEREEFARSCRSNATSK